MIYIRIFLLLTVMFLYGCKTGQGGFSSFPSCLEISPPEINLTGEKTVIERQIVGDYRELEEDAWIIASVKTSVSRTEGSTPVIGGDEELFKALKIREFNADKVREYKNEGALGERTDGFLAYIKTQKYEKTPASKKLLLQLVSDENDARRTIFLKSLSRTMKAEPTGDHIKAFGNRFAEEQRALARKNDWIQDKNGRWIRKK